MDTPSALLHLSYIWGAALSILLLALIIESQSNNSFKLFSVWGDDLWGLLSPKLSGISVLWLPVASGNALSPVSSGNAGSV